MRLLAQCLVQPGRHPNRNDSACCHTLMFAGRPEARKPGRMRFASDRIRRIRPHRLARAARDAPDPSYPLRLHLPDFTLSSVVEEVHRWSTLGRSCFSDLMQKLRM